MQLNTGSTGITNMVLFTRDLAGDPNAAPTPLFTDQRVEDAINAEYLEVYDIARQFGVGQGTKRSYTDIVADQLFYELPDDYMKSLMVEVEGDGKNLSTDSTADPSNLKPLSSDVALQGYEAGIYAETEYYFIHNQHFGIVSPPDTAGTSSLRITYEAESAVMGDTDEPDIPTTYQPMICYLAAIALRETMDLDTAGLERIARRKMANFMRAMHDNLGDFEGQAYVAGLNKGNEITKFGRFAES